MIYIYELKINVFSINLGIKHNDKENANVMKYFAEVICSDAKNGPLSAKSLENLENPSEIPALLYKVFYILLSSYSIIYNSYII